MRWLDGITDLKGHEFEQAWGYGEGQGSLVCCSPWGLKEADMTEELTNSNKVFPGGVSGKEPVCQCRRHMRLGSILGWERYPGGGYGNSRQCYCLENPTDRGVWQDTVHRVAKSQTQLKGQHTSLS